MLKKYIILGSVVLLTAALLVLTGCSQATDSDGGALGLSENHLYGTADAADIAAAVASAKRMGRAVILTDNTTLTGAGALAGSPASATFEDVTVRVEGKVTVTAGIIVNAAFANITYEENATITVTNNGAFIYQGDGDHILTDRIAQGFKVRYMTNPLLAVQGTDAHIAIPSYQMGANFNDVAPHVLTMYVVDKLTVNAASTQPPGTGLPASAGIPQIIALGEVDLTGNNNALFFAEIGDDFQFAASSTLISSVPENVTLDLATADTAVFGTVKTSTPITITGPTSLDLTIVKIEGPETLTITNGANTIDALTIFDVTESGKVTVDTDALTAFTIVRNNAGTITVNADSTIAATGDVVIENNTGTISFNTATFGDANPYGLTIPTPAIGSGRNNGTITITAPTAIAGPITVTTANTGTITLASTTEITGGGTIANNSGTINFTTPSIDTEVFDIPTNTGEINFTKDLDGTLIDYFIKSKANHGSINFWGTITTTDPLGSATAADSVAGNGKVSFGGLASFAEATVIGCDTVFEAGLERTANVALTLNGDVTLGYGQGISLAGVTPLTLGAGKRILIADTPVLAAGNGPVGIVADTATLTAGNARPSDDDGTYVGDKTLTLGGAAITALTGNLRILGGGYLSLGYNVGVTTGSLTLEDGAFIELDDAASIFVTLSNTTITGDATAVSYLTASGGEVTLAANRISGSGTLSIPEESGSPIIAVTASQTLTIAGANLNLQSNGSLTLGANAATKVILEAGQSAGKITLSEEVEYTVTGLNNNVIATNGRVTGGILRGSAETGSSTVGDLSGGVQSNLVISGSGTATAIAAGAAVTL